jgi:hypothetical protein
MFELSGSGSLEIRSGLDEFPKQSERADNPGSGNCFSDSTKKTE